MISLILPYWDRQLVTNKALSLLSKAYSGLDLEVVVVDDGSPEHFVAPETPFPLKVIRLPRKTEAKNPCVPINAGVMVSGGEFVAISNPEILHIKPVLGEMREEARSRGRDAYVLAACWCPEEKRWHCHSSIAGRGDRLTMPKGSGLHFLSLMHRDLWEKTGGFDDDYRDGAGYDDNDFVMRLDRAGAEFVIRDDLVVEHPVSGATSNWKPGAHERNRKLYFEKWGKPLSVFCVLRSGGEYTPRWVERLKNAVGRNLTVPHVFKCLSDVEVPCERLPLRHKWPGWWSKLELFREVEGPSLYLDLDTVVVGNIDHLVNLKSDFCAIRNFHDPNMIGSAVMWFRKPMKHVYERFCEKPFKWIDYHERKRDGPYLGDQAFVWDSLGRKVETFPMETIKSYKFHCKDGLPKEASLVCFGGSPKVYEVKADWIERNWK